ncbi:MAG: Uncharacterized protein FD155_1892 [Bacteroidetes bacterium]|nr:MAG: Uncharacterized protein FD155_1892 [Bacteroidota bacterium]
MQIYTVFIMTTGRKVKGFLMQILSNKPLLYLLSIVLLFGVWLYFTLQVFPSVEFPFENKELKILDVRLWYSEEDVFELFQSLGNQGRAIYFYQVAVIDMIYPLVYGFLLFLIIRLLSNRYLFFKQHSVFVYFPLMAASADILENLNTVLMLYLFPKVIDILCFIGSIFSFSKWLLVVFSILIIMFIPVFQVIKHSFQYLKIGKNRTNL